MDDTIVLIREAQAGNKDARQILVEKNLGLVHMIVRRFSGRGVETEDLFQIGSIGLMKAIDKFNLEFEVKFSTYAVPMITGEIKRFLRDDGMVKVSRTLKENGWKIHKAKQALCHELGKEPTILEIAQRTELDVEEVVLAMEANIQVDSIYRSVYQPDGTELFLVDQVVSAEGNRGIGKTISNKTDTEKEKVINHILLEQLLAQLTEQEREIINLRYYANITQVAVANRLGISQVQVSRLEKKILKGMRKHVLSE
ncbi:MAG: SigB/SigF/SigG family RNA polymerase sigma factor [Eubacteriales bacterium]